MKIWLRNLVTSLHESEVRRATVFTLEAFPLVNTYVSNTMSSVSNNPKLVEADIPGSSLGGRAPANLKVQEHKFCVKCKGEPAKCLKTKGKLAKR